MDGNANQRGERLKHVQHPQRGTYKTEQRTALINSSTELQIAAKKTSSAHIGERQSKERKSKEL